MREHKAQMQQIDVSTPKKLKGEFEVIDGKLSFTCHTENVTFGEVLAGLTMLRDEMNRQIANQEKCPFHPKTQIK